MKPYVLLGGAGMIGLGVLGKLGVKFYRRLRSGKGAFTASMSQIGKYYPGTFQSPMTRHEASLILAVRESADKKMVEGAHRKLMKLNHPDFGGSTYLATKINEAKDLLMK
mmetsp:Transcript_23660/g.26829  ORF Transcript_23660/g.26829 Transcript_23660/m.26829 type:complete len:110 (+) Transcript_23660:69-398(+)